MIVTMQANVYSKQNHQIQQSVKYYQQKFFILEVALVLDLVLQSVNIYMYMCYNNYLTNIINLFPYRSLSIKS